MHSAHGYSYDDVVNCIYRREACALKLERMNQNVLKIFLTLDDLYENGLELEDVKSDSLKVHAIIKGMIEQACQEEDFPFKGLIEIEIFSLHAQGVIMIISRDDETICEEDDLLDLRLYNATRKDFLYCFQFEELVRFAGMARNKMMDVENSIYFLQERYYLYIDKMDAGHYDFIVSLASEFGEASTITLSRLQEYGKIIVEGCGVSTFYDYFT